MFHCKIFPKLLANIYLQSIKKLSETEKNGYEVTKGLQNQHVLKE